MGASAAVYRGGEYQAFTAGCADLSLGQAVSDTTCFQIGSVSKLFTAVLVLQAVARGELALDAPVQRYIPEFTTARADFAARITLRQCLDHSSGLAGDFFPEDDPSGPSIAGYVAKLKGLLSVYAPGEGPMAYVNSAYVILGEVLQRSSGRSWADLVETEIFAPLGMTASFVRPESLDEFPAAIGHLPTKEGGSDGGSNNGLEVVAQRWLSQSMAPAGSSICCPAKDLIRFARALMQPGVLLDAEYLALFTAASIAVPPFSLGGVNHWGLGPMLCLQEDYQCFGHNGTTNGQYARLWCFPEQDCAYVLLCNSPAEAFADAFEQAFYRQIVGCERAPLPQPENFLPDYRRYIGEYSSLGMDHRVFKSGEHLHLHCSDKIFNQHHVEARLLPYSPDVFSVEPLPGSPFNPLLPAKLSFLGDDGRGRALYTRAGVRLPRRVDAPEA